MRAYIATGRVAYGVARRAYRAVDAPMMGLSRRDVAELALAYGAGAAAAVAWHDLVERASLPGSFNVTRTGPPPWAPRAIFLAE